jgi:hypothetical protein
LRTKSLSIFPRYPPSPFYLNSNTVLQQICASICSTTFLPPSSMVSQRDTRQKLGRLCFLSNAFSTFNNKEATMSKYQNQMAGTANSQHELTEANMQNFQIFGPYLHHGATSTRISIWISRIEEPDWKEPTSNSGLTEEERSQSDRLQNEIVRQRWFALANAREICRRVARTGDPKAMEQAYAMVSQAVIILQEAQSRH